MKIMQRVWNQNIGNYLATIVPLIPKPQTHKIIHLQVVRPLWRFAGRGRDCWVQGFFWPGLVELRLGFRVSGLGFRLW